jgi:hypothetical protein
METVKVDCPATRAEAVDVITQVFEQEKGWVPDAEVEIPNDIAALEKMSWFLVRADEQPVGVIRLAYDPPLELPAECEATYEKDFDLEEIQRSYRFVEIGRFMIVPAFRRNIRVALRLMKAAVREVVERGYSHFITDVYEGERHSPLAFHTKVLGFERIGTHRYGELNCSYRRVILVLDIVRAYRRMKRTENKVFRELTAGIHDKLESLPVPAPL